MRIKESKNLKYDKTSKVSFDPEDYDKFDVQPRVCILDRFERLDDALILYFKNNTRAIIKAKKSEGSTEIGLIESKLSELIGHSYEEILDADIL